MLKCIWFVLSDNYHKIITKELKQLRFKMELYQAQVFLQHINQSKEFLQEDDSDVANVCGILKERLYITDDSVALKKLLEMGAYAIALYHRNNVEQDFSAAKYGVEDVKLLDYPAFEEVYRRLAGLPWDILKTKRLFVRESTVEDVEEFYRIYQHPSITRYMENLFAKHEDERAYMQDYIKHIYGFYGYGLWTVILKETGQIIGRAGLSVRAGYDYPELGFVIDVEQQRKGYAFEVCEAILKYAREELQFDTMQALTDSNNIASKNLLVKLGFHYEKEIAEEKYVLYII